MGGVDEATKHRLSCELSVALYEKAFKTLVHSRRLSGFQERAIRGDDQSHKGWANTG